MKGNMYKITCEFLCEAFFFSHVFSDNDDYLRYTDWALPTQNESSLKHYS